MVAGEGERADEEVRVVIEAGERILEPVRDSGREGVLLLHPVDGDDEDVVVDDLGVDLAVWVAFSAPFGVNP